MERSGQFSDRAMWLSLRHLRQELVWRGSSLNGSPRDPNVAAISVSCKAHTEAIEAVIHVVVRMNLGASDLLLDLFEQWSNVLIRIPEVGARKRAQAEGFQSVCQT